MTSPSDPIGALRRRLRLPKAALGLLHEVARHLLRRPVAGFVVFAETEDGRMVLVRRGDTGTWAFPGGTLEWGETLRDALPRELEEETGIVQVSAPKLVGAWSGPRRDPRFHALTVGLSCTVGPQVKPPHNPLEILEVGLFAKDALPHPLAMTHSEFWRALGTDAALE